jgi:multiple sugar transport system permease protein
MQQYRKQLRFLLSPYLVFVFLLVLLPALGSFALSFFSYDAISPPLWNGLNNFIEVLVDPLLGTAVYNSLFFIALAIPLRIAGALVLALLLNNSRPGTTAFRAAVYLPTITPDVAYALLALWIFNPFYGPLNPFLESLSLPSPAWLTDPTLAKIAIVLMSLFQIGEGFIVLLAGLKSVPKEYYDAAKIDGAGWLASFSYITFPLIKPWLVLLTFRDVTLSFQNTFTPAYIMTRGGPYYGTFFMPYMIYEEAFDHFRFGTGAVLMVFLFLITIWLILVFNELYNGWGYQDE